MQITFSGRLGSGKSTVCAILRDKYGYEIYSTGTVQRKVAEEMGVTTLELNKLMKEDPKLDYKIDDAVTALSRERRGDNIVFDSRMAWHFAENTFKVYMYVDPTVAGKRVFAADRGAVEKYKDAIDAKNQLLERTYEENKRYKSIYNVDNLDYNNYNLIIDSTSASPEEIAELIAVSAKEYEESPYNNTKVYLSPYVLYPTKPLVDATEEVCETPSICLKNREHYIVIGHKIVAEAQRKHDAFCFVELSADSSLNTNESIIKEYENSSNFKYETLPESL